MKLYQQPTTKRKEDVRTFIGHCREETAAVSSPAPRNRSAREQPGDVAALSFQDSVALLHEHQLPSGELPLFVSEKADQPPTRYVKTVFLTAYQAALHADIQDPDVRFITQRSLRYLRQERSPDGLWRFFGRDSDIDADIDDTFAALAAFRNDSEIMASLPDILCRLDGLREDSGLYRTWFTRADPRCDLTVNANLLMFLSLMDVDYGLRVALHAAVGRSSCMRTLPLSRYYLSPMTFAFSARHSVPRVDCRKDSVRLPSAETSSMMQTWFLQNSTQKVYSSPLIAPVLALFEASNALHDKTLPRRHHE